MTPNVTAMLIDDTGQPEASETVRFGLDGTAYKIDLPPGRASELRTMIGRYVSVARRKRAAPSRVRQRHQPRTRPDG